MSGTWVNQVECCYVCECVCIQMCVNVCVCTQMCVNVCVSRCVCTQMCVNVCVIQMCVNVCVSRCVHVCKNRARKYLVCVFVCA